MSTSLTQEEFLLRFKERSGPLLLALNSDIEQYRLKLKDVLRIQRGLDGRLTRIDTGDLEIELLKKAMGRLISLVYSNDAS
jgi:hypothetical protein